MIHLCWPDYVGKTLIRKHLDLKCLCVILLTAVYEICCTWLHFFLNLQNNDFLALFLYKNVESLLQKWTWFTFQYFAFIFMCIYLCTFAPGHVLRFSTVVHLWWLLNERFRFKNVARVQNFDHGSVLIYNCWI